MKTRIYATPAVKGLTQCWTTVCGNVSALKQHWTNVSCLLGSVLGTYVVVYAFIGLVDPRQGQKMNWLTTPCIVKTPNSPTESFLINRYL